MKDILDVCSPEFKKYIPHFLAIFSIALLLYTGARFFESIKNIRTSPFGPQTITVPGYAELKAIPDVTSFTFSITHKDATSEKAQKIASQKSQKIIDIIKSSGVTGEDITTQDMSVYPEYSIAPIAPCISTMCPPYTGGEQKINGYTANITYRIIVRNKKEVSKVLSIPTKMGASYVSGISFSLDKPEVYKFKTRLLAIEDAKKKSKEVFKALGIKKGKIINYYEQPSNSVVQPYATDAMMVKSEARGLSSEQPQIIESGQTTFTSNVEVVYEVK